ncbi:hypothetical protein [Micromonospora carbonacea]|uniref:Uncharacterized protein n=1 Tax=Micromonospora carbonacea TaxID=47853 RepID=A0A1C4ZK81_9ACTN|nr:hypothetical protein [Micromonospora carbonacea]SCF33216.1 hypothetical protein GA0070563_108273 [Micromonospora carbonacea]
MPTNEAQDVERDRFAPGLGRFARHVERLTRERRRPRVVAAVVVDPRQRAQRGGAAPAARLLVQVRAAKGYPWDAVAWTPVPYS